MAAQRVVAIITPAGMTIPYRARHKPISVIARTPITRSAKSAEAMTEKSSEMYDGVRAFLDEDTLIVEGTEDDDVIKFLNRSDGIHVIANGSNLGAFTATAIKAYGLGGDDTIRSVSRILAPTTFDGGEGDDLLVGGGGNDILSEATAMIAWTAVAVTTNWMATTAMIY